MIRDRSTKAEPPPAGAEHLRALRMSDRAIGRAVSVSDKTAAKAADAAEARLAARSGATVSYLAGLVEACQLVCGELELCRRDVLP